MSSAMRILFTIAILLAPSSGPAGPRVDLSQDNGRADVLAPGWQHWRVPEKAEVTQKFGDVTVTLRTTSGKLAAQWWKPGFDYLARMASDGVAASDKLELILSGLSPGKHSLGTYHNVLTDGAPSRITITAGSRSTTVMPTVRAKHDADAATAFLEFEAQAARDVTITFAAEASGTVVLNGFEIDRPDLTRRAVKPAPFEDDEHVPENPALAWKSPPGAKSYHIYLGTDAHAVAAAKRDSPEFRGETSEATFPTESLKLTSTQPYFWRVDTVHADRVIRGEVWRFQIRHLAFPEAEGYGRFAIGGRGGKVYEVTNLNDAGPGSLREAVEASGPRTVVFRTGGVVKLQSKLIIQHPYITLAGQTAPGDGICVSGYTFGCNSTHDVILRHVRIRVGDESGTTQDGCGARGSNHCMFDHCSISWSIDEGFSSREAENITLQRCIISEALNIANHRKYEPGKGHSFAGSISGNIGSFHHNLLANCTGRNWSLAGGLDRTGNTLGGRLDIRNNVVFNWRNRTTDGGVRELNFVNNYYLPGPATETFTLLEPDPSDPERGMRAYMSGNVIVDQPQFDADNWKAYVGSAEGLAKVKRDAPLFESFVNTQPAKEAFESVLADVGATLPKQDAIDRRIVSEVRQRKHTYTGGKGKLPGIIDSPKDAGGLPAYRGGEAPLDSDHDGMPDEWERTNGMDPNNAADGSDFRDDGYTHLEHYLNTLAGAQR